MIGSMDMAWKRHFLYYTHAKYGQKLMVAWGKNACKITDKGEKMSLHN